MVTKIYPARIEGEPIETWWTRIDTIWTAHLDRCDACNYDEECVACAVGGREEAGHNCNCSQGCDGGYGARLSQLHEEARKEKIGQ